MSHWVSVAYRQMTHFQLSHGENKLHDDNDVPFVLDKQA